MLSDLRRRARKAGLAPGTLVFTGERRTEHTRITVTDFDPDRLEEQVVAGAEACAPYLGSPSVTWIAVEGLHDVQQLQALGTDSGIHPLVLEDIAHPGQRPKVEVYEDYLFIVLQALVPGPEDRPEQEQISLVLRRNCLLTFQERPSPMFDAVRQRIQASRGRVRRMGVDYLAYALLDAIVDQYFVVLEDIGEAVEDLEESLLEDAGPDCLEALHDLRKDVMAIRRAARPIRNVLNVVLREESPLIQQDTLPFLRDLQDHTLHVVDNVEEFHEVLTSLMEVYLTASSQRTNEVMKVLTVIATIFIPLTFVAGVYGMNFEHMPELHWRWSYPVFWVVIVVVTLVQVYFMWRKRWF